MDERVAMFQGGQRKTEHMKREKRKGEEIVGGPHHPTLIFTHAPHKRQAGYQKELSRWYSLIKMSGTMKVVSVAVRNSVQPSDTGDGSFGPGDIEVVGALDCGQVC